MQQHDVKVLSLRGAPQLVELCLRVNTLKMPAPVSE
jgi:hypothetical protein